MKIVSLRIQPWETTVIVSLEGIGNMELSKCLTERDVADIHNIALRAAQRHLEPQKLLDALEPEVLSLAHEVPSRGEVEDGEFVPAAEGFTH